MSSIYAQTSAHTFEVILINDETGDGTSEFVEANYPQVRLVKSTQRLGVGPARNLGLSMAQGRYLLLLDIDTVTLDHALDKMVDFMDSRPDVGLAGCKLLYPSGELQFTCRKFQSPVSFIFRRTILGKWFPNAKPLRDYLLADWDHTSVYEPDYVSGAFQMIRRKAFERIGYMAPYFHGPEDQEYCYQMKHAGWKVAYYPFAQVIHDYQQVSAKGPFLNRNMRIQMREGLHFQLQRSLDAWLKRPAKYRPFTPKQS